MGDGAAAGVASALDPAGVEAALLHEVTVVLVVGAVLLFAGTAALLAGALRSRARRPVSAAWWVVGGGIVLPVAVLSALLAYATVRTAALAQLPIDPPLVVSITGHLWWWEVRYRDPAGGRDVVQANELRLPVDRPTRIGLGSADVIHSLWVPQLGGKRDLVPGRTTHLVVTPSRPGVYRGACAEFCGLQHTRMALHVIAMPGTAFDRWLADRAQPTPSVDAAAVPAAFGAHGCASCHAVRGIVDGGRLGPDLSDVASRPTLGAGALPNGPGAIRRWLVDVQVLKPGARMPSYAHLDAATLDALAAWLEGRR